MKSHGRLLESGLALLFSAALSHAQAALALRRIAGLDAGPRWGAFVETDLDSNGRPELIFTTGTIRPANPLRWEIWEHEPVNRFRLVYADTGAYPYPPGIVTGNFYVHAGRDLDNDGRFDIVGSVPERGPGDTIFCRLAVMEHTGPDFRFGMAWRHPWSKETVPPAFMAAGDFDQDGRADFLVPPVVFENRGDNSYQAVFSNIWVNPVAVGDFDLDGLTEFVGGFTILKLYENVVLQQDTYALVYTDETGLSNGWDPFAGRDIDQDGKPEFFQCYASYTDDHPGYWFTLYMWETVGNNQYVRHLFGTKYSSEGIDRTSLCADLDADGVEELVWVLPFDIYVYKATGNNRFAEVWHWRIDHHSDSPYPSSAKAYDLNGNGYQELVFGTYNKTSIFEAEAIRVMSPNGGEALHPGDTCWIRWRILSPPRCDSVSLFLKTDTVIRPGERFWRLDTIATGLVASDSVYPWVVPDTVLGAAWVVAVAYGPGWQYDQSDSACSIQPVGLADYSAGRVQDWLLRVAPNPAVRAAGVRCDVPCTAPLQLGVYDASGCLVKLLLSGVTSSGRYSLAWDGRDDQGRQVAPGVYFCTLRFGKGTLKRKLLLLR